MLRGKLKHVFAVALTKVEKRTKERKEALFTEVGRIFMYTSVRQANCIGFRYRKAQTSTDTAGYLK